MDQNYCPQCKSDSYLNPNIKIFISPCYHRMCENCVSRIFSQGESECPECGTFLRKMNFISQTFEDISVERECRIRKILIKVFNKTEEDFESSTSFEDYMEKNEDMVFEMLECKNDMEVLQKAETLKKDTSIHIADAFTKRKKILTEIENKIEPEKAKIIDPLEGIELPSIILKKSPNLPSIYKFECPEGGYLKRITAYRAVYSLLDDKI